MTPELLTSMCIGTPDKANVASFCAGLDAFGDDVGLNRPHRVAQYVGQMMHESAMFRYDRELWGPTDAQKRYDTRTDLGNTAAIDGDGKKYSGRTAIQITGKDNYKQFTAWAQRLDANAPDFVEGPNAANTDPWEGLGPIWYWDTRELNRLADTGDTKAITRLINGGYNGLEDRYACYVRAGLVLLGYDAGDVRRFQSANGLEVDGVAGPATRAQLHECLLAMPEEAKHTPQPAIWAAIAAFIAAIFGGKKK